ncbi:MAG: MFS transporter, partial [Chloroflexota bacterium]|nr:MFS transporter [Chloroflexota bacterium]
RATTSGAFSLAFLIFGLLGILAGRMTDKWGARVVEIACGVLLGVGYLLMSQVSSVWQLYLFYGAIIGAGMSGGDTPVLATAARWFIKRRGTFTGLTKAGAGIGIFVIPPLANWLIASYGWRNAYLVIAGICLIGVVSVALLYKRDPAEMGLLPDGAVKIETTGQDMEIRQYTFREMVRTRQFWILASAWFLVVFSVQIILAHIVPHMTDLGLSPALAASIFGIIGVASIIGRVGMGGVSDRLGKKRTLIIAVAFMVAALSILQFAREAWAFYLFAIVDGISHGALFTVISLVLAELFGLRSLGAALGAVLFSGTVGGAIGPVLAGYIFDVTGGYQLAFIICLAFSIIAISLLPFVKPTGSKVHS